MVKSTFFSRFQDWISEWDETKTRQVLVVLLAVLVGLLVGLVIDLFARLGLNYVFTPPVVGGLKTDPVDMAAQYVKFPVEIFTAKIVAWGLGALAGGYTAVRMAKKGQFPAWIVGILLFASYLIGLINPLAPTWVLVACPLVVGICAYAAGWLGMYVTVQKIQAAEARA